MKLILLFITLFTLCFSSFAQLDPFYFGTYVDDEFTVGYTIYTMDEVEDDCFLVEYEEYENYQTIYGVSGFGQCDGEDGGMKIRFEDPERDVTIAFGIDEHGLKNMTIIKGNSVGKVFREYNDFVPEGAELSGASESEEIYYSREDGSELVVYAIDNGNEIGFSIYSLSVEGCESNDLGGKWTPLNDEHSLYEFKVDGKCRIEFQISTDSINIVEENCENNHNKCCGKWEGLYLLNR